MIIHGGMLEIEYYRKVRELVLSDEDFFSLPYECQQAILMAGDSSNYDMRLKRENDKKRRALKQYELEENVKEKVLSLLKKK